MSYLLQTNVGSMYVCDIMQYLKMLLFGKSKCYLTKYVAAYAAEQLVLQETFLKLKIPGL